MNEQELVDRINFITSKLVDAMTETSGHYARAQALQNRVNELESILNQREQDKVEIVHSLDKEAG